MQTQGRIPPLSSLDRYFAALPSELAPDLVSEQARAWLQHILDMQHVLKRQQKQVTFVGAFKAGKSTLLNALIGRQILPSRSIHATGVITEINYAHSTSASVVRRGANGVLRQGMISFDDLAKYILLDASSVQVAKAPQGVDKVIIGIPLPLLQHGYVLVDTPGLMDDQALTQQALRELERTDLAIMVLSADKLLSLAEKEIIKHIQSLLQGNVVFVINRLDLIDEEDKEDVLDWTRSTLRGIGNAYTGYPRLFATEAKKSLDARKNGHKTSTDGLGEFEHWLESVVSTSIGVKIVQLSRLSILEYTLTQAQVCFKAQLTKVEDTEQKQRTRELLLLQSQQEAWRKKMATYRLSLAQCRSRLDTLGNTFVSNCLTLTREVIAQYSRSQWADTIPPCLIQCVQTYADALQKEVREALTGISIRLPLFNPGTSNTHTQISVAGNATGKVGAAVGALGLIWGIVELLIGASLGGWVVNAIFSVDVKQKTLETVEQAVYSFLPTLRVEAEKYIDCVDDMVVAYSKAHTPTWQPSDQLLTGLKTVNYYKSLVHWCDEFRQVVTIMKKGIIQ